MTLRRKNRFFQNGIVCVLVFHAVFSLFLSKRWGGEIFPFFRWSLFSEAWTPEFSDFEVRVEPDGCSILECKGLVSAERRIFVYAAVQRLGKIWRETGQRPSVASLPASLVKALAQGESRELTLVQRKMAHPEDVLMTGRSEILNQVPFQTQ